MTGKIVIGLVGEKCGGKGTSIPLLKKLLPNTTISHHRFSDPHTETLKAWRLATTRENYQKLTPMMRQTYGAGVLANAIKHRAQDDPAPIVVLDGVRWWEDVEMLKGLSQSRLIYITADAQTRYERSRLRKEKAGEGETSLEQFLIEEEAETEKDIPAIGKTADTMIENNGTIPEFEEKIKEAVEKILIV